VGIVVLFAGGLVEFVSSDKGQMTLYEPRPPGEPGGPTSSDRFLSYYEWELSVLERRPDGSAVEHVVPWSELEGLDAGDTLRATAPGLAVDVRVSGWTRNAETPKRASSRDEGVEGWTIPALEEARDAAQNLPAAVVALAPKGSPTGPRGVVWAAQAFPWATTVAGRDYEVDLRRRSWRVPFTLRLDRFVMEMHPGTSMPSRFSSYVTKNENGVERKIHVTMNEPLRHRGYTFYQSGWGPQGSPEGTPRWSTFAVVKNPADRVPIIGCLVIALGLAFHFLRKLFLHILRTSDAAAAGKAAT
jgi:hypothetical protein